jgi:hypothetical protein
MDFIEVYPWRMMEPVIYLSSEAGVLKKLGLAGLAKLSLAAS